MSNAYYWSPEWFRLKDFVKALAGTTCEMCECRPASDLHHVVYTRFGAEAPADVALVCRECHSVIHHRFRGTVKYKPGSPLAERLFGGELVDYLIDKRDREWTAYKERLELLQEVTGCGDEMIAQGEAYFNRCEVGLT